MIMTLILLRNLNNNNNDKLMPVNQSFLEHLIT